MDPKWKKLPEKYKWLLRIALFLAAAENGREAYIHFASGNPVIAVFDVVFVVVCLWLLIASLVD